ncbi:hypothetical protein EW146_g6748 [Bondarzewia mesenterica]|uniref:hydroxyisourate hydrolase n=1 Tax=Bondarzewia mesenterica TaxID=1095465 RepID=A0A4S4LMP4_9AGAM|nr:hypothetical protein EW146_g6748 [Bondarzewia mesenterica]
MSDSENTALLVDSPTTMNFGNGSAKPTDSVPTYIPPPPLPPPKWIPEERSNRTLVLCFDGTGDQFDKDNSNIVQFLSMLRKDDPSKQLVYYQAGIGTYTNPILVTPVLSQASRTLDMMFAWNLGSHVRDGYEFLMQNCRDTVASVGIVPRTLPFVGTNDAIRYFRHALALDERRTKFMPSYYIQSAERGQPSQDQAPAQPPPARKHTSHVKAYEDEENAKSGLSTNALEVWFAGVHCDVGGGSVETDERHSLARIPLRWMIRECFRTNTGIIFDANMLENEVGLDVDFDAMTLKAIPARLAPRPAIKVDHIKPDDKIPGFFPTLWHFVWDTTSFPFVLLARLIIGKTHEEQKVEERERFLGEDVEELNDVLSPMYDQLPRRWYWRLIEWMPLRSKKQKAIVAQTDNRDDYVWTLNRGQGRKIFQHVMDRELKVHRSVKTRLEALDAAGKVGTYVPQIRPKVNGVAIRMTHEDWNVEQPKWFKWFMSKSPITCHVLDSSLGKPAAGVQVTLQECHRSNVTGGGDVWEPIANGQTNTDGRCIDLLPAPGSEEAVGGQFELKAGGLYKIAFKTKEYFEGTDRRSFYPWVEIPFEVVNPDEHYHIPLLISPYSYTTYRGS